MDPRRAWSYFDVFLSYRRDHASEAQSVRTVLKQRGYRVFLDVRDLKAGYFDEDLVRVIQRSANVVCLLTPGSLERCDQPGDWVRRELEVAFEERKNLVLVNYGHEPEWTGRDLPASLARLPMRNFVSFQHDYFDAFIEKLCSQLEPTAAQLAAAEFADLDDNARNPEYRAWQCEVLQEIYGDLARQAAGEPGVDFFPRIAGERYPVFTLRASGDDQPFEHEFIAPDPPIQRSVQELPDLASEDPLPSWVVAEPGGADRCHYFELLAATRRVRRWNMRGFALRTMRLDAAMRVTSMTAELCTYGENCLTSHLLGYRMLKAFTGGRNAAACREGRPQLHWRRDAATGRTVEVGFDASADFHPLISVQALVVYRDRFKGNKWHVVAMKRAGQLAAAVGFWQFPPAGGFEIYGNEKDEDEHVASQFDMRWAILREFLEEIYGDPDMACEIPEAASGDQSGSRGYRRMMDAVLGGGLKIHLLGVVMELVGLRSEFSFLIVMEDRELFDLSYEVAMPNNQKRTVKWLFHGGLETDRLLPLRVDGLGETIQDKTWNPSSIAMLKLLADLSLDRQSWLVSQYPDFPEVHLP